MPVINTRVAKSLSDSGVIYKELACEAEYADTEKYCQKYNFPLSQCANTILVTGKDNKSRPLQTVACVVLANDRLDVNKKIRKLIGAKKASFTSAEQTVALTGMKIGGVVVFGLPDNIKVFVDQKVVKESEVIMGGGNRSSKILLGPAELNKLPNYKIDDISI